MPAPYGIVAAGFNRKTLLEAKAAIEEDLRAVFGASIDLNPESVFGQLTALRAEREAAIWEGMEEVYSNFYRDTSTGTSLDQVGGLTASLRAPALVSTAIVTAAGTPTTVLPVGRVVQVEAGGATFETTAGAVIAALTAWATATAYVVGDRRTANGNAYEAIDPGNSAGAGTGPAGTSQAIVDGGVIWKYIGTGTGVVDVEVDAQDSGPKVAPALTLNVIVTAVSGWNTVRNLADATVGADTELDAAYRLRQEAELRRQGNASIESIRAKLLLSLTDGGAGAVAATVFENDTMATDVDGIPAKSIEALVTGGLDADIRAAIFASKAGGIQAHGTTSGTVVDSTGISHTIKFSRPTVIPIYVVIDVKKDPALYPADGDAQIEAALVAWGDANYVAGKNVVASKLEAVVHGISGVEEVLAKIGTAAAPTLSVTIAIALRELADLDTARITVNATDFSP